MNIQKQQIKSIPNQKQQSALVPQQTQKQSAPPLTQQQNPHPRKKRRVEVFTFKKYYYHYTNEKGFNGIKESLTIKPSPEHCLLGEGVYFTTRPPQTSSNNLLKGSYGGVKAFNSRTQYYVRIPSNQIQISKSLSKDNREVHVYSTNQPLDLNKFSYKFGQRKRFKDSSNKYI